MLESKVQNIGTRVLKSIVVLVVVNLIWLGLAAFHLVPFLEYLSLSSRAGGVDPGSAMRFSFSLPRALGFVFPEFVKTSCVSLTGNCPTGEGLYANNNWAVSLYLGTGLVFLVGAARFSDWKKWIVWVSASAVFLAFALGSNLPGYGTISDLVPLLRMSRYSEKYLVGLHLLLVWGAAVGLSCCIQNHKDSIRVSLASFVAAICFAGSFLIGQSFQTLILFIMLLCITALMFLMQRYRKLAYALVVSIVLFDLWSANANLLETLPWQRLADPPRAANLIKQVETLPRIYSNPAGIPETKSFPRDEILKVNLLSEAMAGLYQISNLNAPASINLLRHEELISALSSDEISRACRTRLLANFGVRFVTSYIPLDKYSGMTVHSGPTNPNQPYLYAIPSNSPRIYIAKNIVFADSFEAVIDKLCSALDSKEMAVVRQEDLPANFPLQSQGKVVIKRYSADEVRIDADLEAPGLLVLNDSYFPGWQATVNGSPQSIIPVNQQVRGLVLEKGPSSMVFSYKPFSYRIGAIISTITFLLLVAYCFLPRKYGSAISTKIAGE